MLGQIDEIKIGPPTDFRNFMNAVIDKGAFDDHVGYIEHAKASSDAEILIGGNYDDSEGYFVEPTVVLTTDPRFKLMEEEIFGPVLTLFVYDDADLDETLELCDTTSPYALTGAIFADDRLAGDQDGGRAAPRRRQLLHQRQAHRRGGRPAALRRLRAPRAPTTRRARTST